MGQLWQALRLKFLSVHAVGFLYRVGQEYLTPRPIQKSEKRAWYPLFTHARN